MSRTQGPVLGRRGRAAAAVALAALLTGGCGATEALVGLQPVPAADATSAPLDAAGAEAIAIRVLAEASTAESDTGKSGEAARAAVFTGDALTWANAVAAAKASEPASTPLTPDPAPKVLAQSQGRGWPRALLVTTLRPQTSTQSLHVLVSESPTVPFKVAASVPMLGGSTLPGIGSPTNGTPLLGVNDADGRVLAPTAALTAYAASLGYPKPTSNAKVATTDPFVRGLRASASAQGKALGKLATFTQEHKAAKVRTVVFQLADGGAVVFGLMTRTDKIVAKATAKEIRLTGEWASATGKKKATKSATLTSLESVVLVVPAAGMVTAIGAEELLVSGRAS